jgi:hypothetical protein
MACYGDNFTFTFYFNLRATSELPPFCVSKICKCNNEEKFEVLPADSYCRPSILRSNEVTDLHSYSSIFYATLYLHMAFFKGSWSPQLPTKCSAIL